MTHFSTNALQHTKCGNQAQPTAQVMAMVQTLMHEARQKLGKHEADAGHERGHTSF